jgi:hypothetical protein
MDAKRWWASKTVWSGIIAAVVAAYNTAAPSFGWTAIPEWVFGILSAIGIYSRVTATTVLK